MSTPPGPLDTPPPEHSRTNPPAHAPEADGGTGGSGHGGIRRPRIAVSVAFGLQGFTLSMLLTLLPQFRDRFGLADAAIVGVVVLASVIAGAGSLLAESLASRTDSRVALRTGFAVIVAAVIAVAVSPGIGVFVAGFAVYGVGLGMVDAATNMQGVALQHRAGRFIMSSFYAAWSVGAIAGALLVAAFSGMDLGLRTTLFAGVGLVAVAAAAVSPRFFRPTAAAEPSPEASAGQPRIPLWPFLALGSAMALFYGIDFAVGNWSALFMTDVVLADSGTAALAMAAYQVAALISRLTGDLWVRRFGETAVVRAGAAVAIVGLVLVVAAQSVPMALAGFLIVGLGAPLVAPLCFGAAGRLAPGQADAVIARINLFNYAGTIIGGGMVGGVAALSNLRVAFVLPLLFALVLAALAPAFRRRRGTPRASSAASGTRAAP
ncbi:MFS transporter [Tomitella fengzijianii]|uniref:MFS transporter n=1 Tax=Tomitella fengzijianii TaxID=2597660 RepID=UPI0022A683B5|nr:MFS transporter [Tomitella fengzijianii]